MDVVVEWLVTMDKWSRAAVYVLLASAFLGFFLYMAFNYLISWASSPDVIYGAGVTYVQSTVLRDLIPMFFLTALGFLIASVGLGLYLGAYHMIEEVRWESLVYFFGSALLVDFLLNVTFYHLVDEIPTLPGLGASQQGDTLLGFFSGTCLLPLLCFVLAGIWVGSHIGSHADRET